MSKTKKPAAKAAPAKPAAKKPAAAKAVGPVLQMCNITELTIDPELQQRTGLSDALVAEYSGDVQEGVVMPPIDAFEDAATGVLIVADGFHRVAAYEKAGLSEIAVLVHQGTRDDAVWFACGANKSHGLRRTTADKRKAVTNALLIESIRSTMSERMIAEHCGVSGPMVASIRKSLVEAGTIADTTDKEESAKKSAAGKASVEARQAKAPPKPVVARPEVEDEFIDDGDAAGELGVGDSQGESVSGASLGGMAPTPPKRPDIAKATAAVNDGVLLDVNGATVPDELHAVFGKIDQFHQIARVMYKLAESYREMAKGEAGLFLDANNADLIDAIADGVVAATPYNLDANNKIGWAPTHPDKVEAGKENLEPKATAKKKK